MNATITNVSGEDNLVAAVLRCWMSLFSPRVITYRASRGFTADPAMAVVVQTMVDSEKAGVAFTADPSSGALDRVVIEAAFGLGEVVVSGAVEPDTYIVSKETLKPLDIRVGHKSFKIVRGVDGHDHAVDLDDGSADTRVLDDDELRSITELAVATEQHNGCPQDTEWAIADGKTYLVQARPITTLPTASTDPHAVLVRGLAAAMGTLCPLTGCSSEPESTSTRTRSLLATERTRTRLPRGSCMAPVTARRAGARPRYLGYSHSSCMSTTAGLSTTSMRRLRTVSSPPWTSNWTGAKRPRNV